MTTREQLSPPNNLPKCECFQTSEAYTWSRCCDVGNAVQEMSGAFHHQVREKELCPVAVPYLLDLVIINLLAYVVRSQGPAIEYGSEDMEREVERLLSGLETRVLARNREAYAAGRKLGMTEEVVTAMRERTEKGSQS